MDKIKCKYEELLPIHKIIPNPKNNNIHPEEQIDRLAKIIDYQGMRSPLIISKRSGFLIKGHGRLMALKKLGWENIPVEYQEYENEAQEYADMTADNEIARWATMDFTAFQEHIDEIDIDDFELFGMKLNEEDLKIDIHDEPLPFEEEERKFIVETTCKTEEDQAQLYDDLISKGFNSRKKG